LKTAKNYTNEYSGKLESVNSTYSSSVSHYQPASLEHYIMTNEKHLGYDRESSSLCPIYDEKNKGSLMPETHWDKLQIYIGELEEYSKLVLEFEPISDLRQINAENVCDLVKLHPDDMLGIFKSGELSRSPKNGYLEPLFPPLRHPGFCLDRDKYVVDLSYLLHDWHFMCQNLKRTSRTVFVDIGASLTIHTNEIPAFQLINTYNKFGFHFDHIYAFEATPTNTTAHYEMVPRKWLKSYHWINTPVIVQEDTNRNPWSFLKDYSPDDFIVVKLDIDTPSVELPLVQQLLYDKQLYSRVDHFYFEHHVKASEMYVYWGRRKTKGTVYESLQLFTALREKGVAAHFWI